MLFRKDAFRKENSEFNQKNAASLSTVRKLWLITHLLSWRRIPGKGGTKSELENLGEYCSLCLAIKELFLHFAML